MVENRLFLHVSAATPRHDMGNRGSLARCLAIWRHGELGLYTTSDLAQADAGELRSALGHISRLVDVDAWIRSAQLTAGCASTKPDRHGALQGAIFNPENPPP
jgi:hypothetical protein